MSYSIHQAQLVQEKLLSYDPSLTNELLFILALTSVMSIAALGIGIAGWMLRDTWRDRRTMRFGDPLFHFRIMKMMIGVATFLRAMPEVLYLQTYQDGTIQNNLAAEIYIVKQMADATALWFSLGWLILLALIYPPVFKDMIASHATETLEHKTTWKEKIIRPIFCFVCVFVISVCFASVKMFNA